MESYIHRIMNKANRDVQGFAIFLTLLQTDNKFADGFAELLDKEEKRFLSGAVLRYREDNDAKS